MRRLYVLVWLIGFTFQAQAQFPQFHKVVIDTTLSTFSTYATSFDSGFVVQTNSNWQSNTSTRQKILLLDKFGNITKQKDFYPQNTSYRMDVFGYMKTIRSLGDSVLYVAEGLVNNSSNASNRSTLYKLDTNLDVQWSKTFPNTFNYTRSALALAGANVLCSRITLVDTTLPSGTITINHYDPVVYKFAPDGTLIWGKQYTSKYSASMFVSAFELRNGNVALTTGGMNRLQFLNPDTVFFGNITMLDSSGNVKWSKRYNTFFADRILETRSGNYLIAGDVILDSLHNTEVAYALFDSTFNPIWIKAIVNNNWASFNGLAEDESGHFILGGEYTDAGKGYPLILKVDANGDILENYVYNDVMIPYHHFSKDKLGRYIWACTDSALRLVVSSTDTIGELNGCPYTQACNIKVRDAYTYVMPYIWYATPANNFQDFPLLTAPSANVSLNYCTPPPLLDASFSLNKDTVCVNEVFSLNSAPGVYAGVSEWIIRDSLTGYYAQFNVSNAQLLQTGIYAVTHIHHLLGCSDTAIHTLVVRTSLSAANDTVTFCDTAGATKIISAVPGAANYNWNTGETTPAIQITQSGIYSYRTDYGCGPDTGYINAVFQYPNQLGLSGDTMVCADKTPLFIGITGGYTSYLWNTGSTAPQIAVTDSGLYRLTATNACGLQVDSIQVSIAPMPIANDVTNYLSIEAGAETELQACAVGMNYNWSGPAITKNNRHAIEIMPLEAATYQCVITTAFGCEATCNYVVEVRTELLVPTAFSPNGDGVNDVFRLLNKNISLKQFSVYNRWGELVFSTDDLLQGWDGTYKDVQQPLGTYVWMAEYIALDKPQLAKGNVTLVR